VIHVKGGIDMKDSDWKMYRMLKANILIGTVFVSIVLLAGLVIGWKYDPPLALSIIWIGFLVLDSGLLLKAIFRFRDFRKKHAGELDL
jgi:hypothetical protein